jgi:hypothetical protein
VGKAAVHKQKDHQNNKTAKAVSSYTGKGRSVFEGSLSCCCNLAGVAALTIIQSIVVETGDLI